MSSQWDNEFGESKSFGVDANPQAQLLLTTLGHIITAIVKSVVFNLRNYDSNEIIDVPEAESFLSALQSYIASMLDSTKTYNRGSMKKEIDLDEIINQHTNEEVDSVQAEEEGSDTSDSISLEDSIIMPQSNYEHFFSKALAGLRERVFNEMPIRLLCFQKTGSTLNITLLDRTEIYSFLVPKLEERIRALADEIDDDLDNPLFHFPTIPKPGSLPHREDDSLTSGAHWDSESLSKYSILSHTWLRSASGEITYEDWRNGTYDLAHPGYRKLVSFCWASIEDHGISLGWMDTVCINKDSSSELDESIRSMYKWYEKSAVCITYLAETTSTSDMAHDAWFTRGWTLQELLAPFHIKFYDRYWNKLFDYSWSDKYNKDIQRQIEIATRINGQELLATLSDIPISRKMEWAARRQVTRGEDSSYSLMGVFGINMSIAYGEGAACAFNRLVKEILNTSKTNVLDIFNWGGDYSDSTTSVLLPFTPRAYLQRSTDFNISTLSTFIEPLTITHLGLRVPVLLLPSMPIPTDLALTEYNPIGDYYATVSMRMSSALNHIFTRVPKVYNVLDEKALGSSLVNGHRWAFAVLNCGGDETSISVPVNCFAVAIKYRGNVFMTPLTYKEKIPAGRPVTFQLFSKLGSPKGDDNDSYFIRRDELPVHGMQFLNMYF